MLFFSCPNADSSWKYNYIADPVNQKMCQAAQLGKDNNLN